MFSSQANSESLKKEGVSYEPEIIESMTTVKIPNLRSRAGAVMGLRRRDDGALMIGLRNIGP